MNLLDANRKDVLKQREEEAVNYFTKVADFRDFTATKPAPDVSVSAKLCYLTAKRLKSDNGTRVPAIDHNQHGIFDQTVEALNYLTPSKRKIYIAQFTIWYGKSKIGVARIRNVDFRPGVVCEFR
ncbi:hypothetical protein V7S43_017956 [Phytophthora oleae]|uniref:Uncharacterized protein n=1 Tax=Phytophthora oleae TaxID=2107226 RepID=A0ABD3ES65_9STRA